MDTKPVIKNNSAIKFNVPGKFRLASNSFWS